MKNLIIATLCLLALIVPWSLYDYYASETIYGCTDILDKEVLPAITDESWQTAEENYNIILDEWSRFETIAEFFLDTEAVNKADELINKTKYHIIMHDASNSAADVSELKHLLNYLYENEVLSTGNVF